MNRDKYIKNLNDYFVERNVSKSDIEKIILEYGLLYDEAIDNGLDDESVAERLGTPKVVFQEVKGDLKYVTNKYQKLVAISPFITLVLFFTIGQLYNAYDWAWLVFLIIPVTAIMTNTRGSSKYIALSPFVSVILFFIIGNLFDVWHPAWLIFLLVPFVAILLNNDKYKIVALSPIVITVIYILIAYFHTGFYLYGWVLYLLTPIIYLLTPPFEIRKFITTGLIVLSATTYLFIGFNENIWDYSLFIFIVPTLYALLTGQIKLNIKDAPYLSKDKFIMYLVLILIIYLSLSLIIPSSWAWTWMVLLSIPMLSIYAFNKFNNFVAYVPFLATIVGFSLGHFFNLWNVSWLAYLSIPVAAILLPNNNKKTENPNE